MIYLASASGPVVKEAMSDGRLGQMCNPNIGQVVIDGTRWAADNGCFSDRWEPVHWFSWLIAMAPRVDDRTLFVVAPDVVCDPVATAELWNEWHPQMAELLPSARIAWVAQNGATPDDIPDGAGAVFIGGDDQWKDGLEARAIAHAAHDRELWVHYGRVNTKRRMMIAALGRADSVDGTCLKYGPDKNLPIILRQMAEVERAMREAPLF